MLFIQTKKKKRNYSLKMFSIEFNRYSISSIDYYEKIIDLCLKYNPNNLENIINGYKGMIETYKQQQLTVQYNSENIFIELNDDMKPIESIISTSIPIFKSIFENIKPLDCAIDCYNKRIDPQIKNELDFRKRIIYCRMKLAALYYDQKELINAQNSLLEVKALCQEYNSELLNIIKFCDENLSFIKGDFDFIIQSYTNRLSSVTNIIGNCIDEDNYCYIAQLYEKKNDFNSAFEYLQESIKYFEEYNYICSHTIVCYIKLAEHYQLIKN